MVTKDELRENETGARKRLSQGPGYSTTRVVLHATLRVNDPQCWVTALAPELGLEIRVVGHKEMPTKMARDLVSITLNKSEEETTKAIGLQPSVVSYRLQRTEPRRLFGLVDSRGCSACTTATSSRCMVLESVCRASNMAEWKTIAPDAQALSDFVTELRRRNCQVEIVRLGGGPGENVLTPRQREVLSIAADLGYFEIPRRVRLAELAKRVGVSDTAVAALLRRAEKRVLGSGHF